MDTAIPRLGVVLVPYTGSLEGATPTWPDLLAAARLAEDIGFDSVWIPDHLMFRSEHGTGGAWESTTLLAAMGAATRSITLGSAVIATSFRNPALLAKIAATVDEITGGRFVLGIGAGWNEVEFRAYGYPTDHRVTRFSEALHIITGLLRNGSVDFEGRFHVARECVLEPRRAGTGPPIMVGTLGQRMMGIAAEYADRWNAWLPRGGVGSPASSMPEALVPLLARIDEACLAAGRDPSTLERSAAVAVDTGGSASGLVSQWGEVLAGTPEELAQRIREFGALGVDELMLALDPPGPVGIERIAPVLGLLAENRP